MLYEEWKSRYKNLKNFNTVLQRCPRFWPLAPPRGMNPGVYSLGISEDPPRYLSSKFDASVRSDCWDISIWKTLTQCDGNGNANTNDRGDYNSSPCTSYRGAKNINRWHFEIFFLISFPRNLAFIFHASAWNVQSTLVISESKRPSEILRDIRTLTYQICRIEDKINQTTTFHKCICNLTPEVRDVLKILWKRGEIAP